MIDKVYSWDLNKFIETINALVEESNVHERQIDELQMKLEPEKLERAQSADTIILEKELSRTKKQLEIAVDGIKYMRNNCLEYAADYMDKADETLEQITALEQKE